MAYNPQNPNGQATSANSSPVVVASDQSTLPVNVQNFPATSTPAPSVLSSGNTTTTPLAANATFVGAWEDVSAYSTIVSTGYVDQNSSTNGAVIQFSNDGTTVIRQSFTSVTAPNYGFPVVLPVEARYFRVVYTNGGTAQGVMDLQTYYHYGAVSPVMTPLGAAISANDLASLTRSVNNGYNSSASGYYPIQLDASNNLNVNINAAASNVPIQPLTTYDVNQVNVATTATVILNTGTTGRKSVAIKASASNTYPIYIGPTSGVTTGSGWELVAGESIVIEIDNTTGVYGIAKSGTQVACYMEIS